jgi:hypothetical protein
VNGERQEGFHHGWDGMGTDGISPQRHRGTEKNSLTTNAHEYTRIPIWPPRCAKGAKGKTGTHNSKAVSPQTTLTTQTGIFFPTKDRPPSAVDLLRRTGKDPKAILHPPFV